jgi:hypothetical protein
VRVNSAPASAGAAGTSASGAASPSAVAASPSAGVASGGAVPGAGVALARAIGAAASPAGASRGVSARPKSDLHRAVVGEHVVPGLEVAVRHAGGVARGQPGGDRGADPPHLGRRQRRRDAIEALAAHQLLHQVRPPVAGLAGAVHRDDVGVREPGDRAGLDQEPLARRGVGADDQLDRHRPVEHDVVPEEHLAHAAPPQRPDDPVVTEVGVVDHRPRAYAELPAIVMCDTRSVGAAVELRMSRSSPTQSIRCSS